MSLGLDLRNTLLLLISLIASCGRPPLVPQARQVVSGTPDQSPKGYLQEFWNSYPIKITLESGISPPLEEELYLALDAWEKTAGTRLFDVEYNIEAQNIEGNPIYTLMGDGINGIYFLRDWQATTKPMDVLATTSWANFADTGERIEADILFNNQTYSYGNSMQLVGENGKRQIDTVTVAVHELGHLLGLEHCEHDESVMYPHVEIEPHTEKRIPNEEDASNLQKLMETP